VQRLARLLGGDEYGVGLGIARRVGDDLLDVDVELPGQVGLAVPLGLLGLLVQLHQRGTAALVVPREDGVGVLLDGVGHGIDVGVGDREDRLQVVDVAATDDLLGRRHVSSSARYSCRQQTRQEIRAHEAADGGVFTDVETVGRTQRVGQDDPREPFGSITGFMHPDVGLEKWSHSGSGEQQHALEALESDGWEHELRLVLQHESKGVVLQQTAPGVGDPADEQVLEFVDAGELARQPGEEALELALDHGGDDLVLAARELAVDRGPATSRLPGKVVEGGLGQAPSAHAAKGALADAISSGRRRSDGDFGNRH
jgi:hypothetical protein